MCEKERERMRSKSKDRERAGRPAASNSNAIDGVRMAGPKALSGVMYFTRF